MEIIVKFGYRWYIFYSRSDVILAAGIYAQCSGGLEDFERLLEAENIEFNYELNP